MKQVTRTGFIKAIVSFVESFIKSAFALIDALLSDTTGSVPPEAAAFYFKSIYFPQTGIKISGVLEMAELKEGQFFTAEVALRTRGGHTAAYQTGSGVWTSSDETVATVEVDSTSELKATITGVDGENNGSAMIEFRADGDPGEGAMDVIATLAVTVTQGNAVVAEITVGDAQDVPAAA